MNFRTFQADHTDRAEEGTGGLFIPERSATERLIALGIFVAACLYLSMFRRYTSIDPDEGIVLQGTQRILRGEVLYRDFFSFLTPGSFYLLALIFKIFGDSMLVARTALAVYGGIFSVFTYWVARRTCSRSIALMTAYVVIVACLPWRFMTLHNWDSTVWACLAVYCAIVLIQSPHWGWALGLGTFVSFTLLSDQSKGAGLFCGLFLGFAVAGWIGHPVAWLDRSCRIATGAGLVWPVLATLGYFGAHHALGSLFADWAWAPFHYSSVNRVPYGFMDWSDQERTIMFASGPWAERLAAFLAVSPCFLIPALPIVGFGLLPYWILAARRGLMNINRAIFYIVMSSAVGGLLASVIVVRAGIVHFVYLAPVFYLVLAWILDGKDLPSSIVRGARPVLIAGVLIAFSLVGAAFLVVNRNAHSIAATRRGDVALAAPETVISYTQAHVRAGSSMLVYPYLPLYYYLTSTHSPTRYEYFQPGMHTREQSEEAINEIEVDRTATVLLEPSFYEKVATSWPNTPLRFLANDPIGDYIRRNYHSCAILVSGAESRFFFMVRNGSNCPDEGVKAELRR